MDDLISRQAAIDVINHEIRCGAVIDQCGLETAHDIIENLPSAQPEIIKGKWLVTEAWPHRVYCSCCHKTFAEEHWRIWKDGSLSRNFCPNCGADMRGETE